MRNVLRGWVLLPALAAVLVSSPSGLAAARSTSVPAPTARTVHLTLRDLGAQGPVELRGVAGTADLPVGSRTDERVVKARLHLRYSYSPSMLPDLSHLRISLNGEPAGALPLPRETAGHEIERVIDLNPQDFADFNHLRLQLVGHYTHDCEDPYHTALWATISDRSELELDLAPTDLRNDLALLPVPFFDRRDSGPLSLPMVLPQGASMELLRSAGVLASWFGTLADYRRAEFPVLDLQAAPRHALILATNRSKPVGLTLPDVTAPTIRVVDRPGVSGAKLLVLMGTDDAQLRTAVLGLVLGDAVLSGAEARVGAVRVPKRVPYDTPRWVRTDRPVHFSELASSPDVLEVHGKNPGPIRLNLRLPPDLMTWQQAGLPIDLRYRYTAPIERDDSSLTVEVNDRLARVIHLRPEADAIGSQRLMVPLVPSSVLSDDERVALPGVQIGTDNVLSLRFALDTHIQGVCRERMPDVQRSSVDPDSTLDLTGFRHYAAMPNLALFAHAGYPYTRLADLSETVVILKEPGNAAAVSAYLQLMGRFGRLTGVPATGLRLAAGNAPRDELKDADLLVLATTSDGLAAEGSGVGVVLDSAQSGLRKAQGAGDASPGVEVTAGGSLGVLQGFESPVSRGRSVVTLLASDADARGAVLQVLETRTGAVTGDVMIVRGDSIRTFHQGRTYYVGDLPLGSRVWYTLARHPLLTTLGALVLVALLGFVSLAALRRRAARRLGKTDLQ